MDYWHAFESPIGLVAFGWDADAPQVCRTSLRGYFEEGVQVAEVPAPLQSAHRQLQAYCCGDLQQFDLSAFDLAVGAPFTREVLRVVAAIPYGQLASYGEVARRADSPNAARAVGNAMNRNPLPIVVPCHRVVAGNGIGGFGCGLEMKRRLHQLENISLT